MQEPGSGALRSTMGMQVSGSAGKKHRNSEFDMSSTNFGNKSGKGKNDFSTDGRFAARESLVEK